MSADKREAAASCKQAAWLENAGVLEATLEDLAASLKAANRTWPEFVHEAEANEWDLGDISIRWELHANFLSSPP